MNTNEIIIDKIMEIIKENDDYTAADVIKNIMLELASVGGNVDREGSVNRTIDMVCEETFG